MTTPAEETHPRLPIVGAAQLTLTLTHGGQPAAVVLGFALTGASAVTTDLATKLRDHAWTVFRPLMVGTVACTGAVLRSGDVDNATIVEVGAPATPTGSAAGSEGIASGTTLIKWKTATGGRSGKGRTFLPGLSKDYVGTDGRTYTTIWQQALPPKIDAYLAPITGATDVKPAVLSFRRGERYVITSGALSPIVGLQRRRMRA